METPRKDLKVISFLAALGPRYDTAKNQLLSGADLPTLNATFAQLSRIFVEVDSSTDSERLLPLLHPQY